ncbi:MAG: hypothetical protein B6I24_11120 [Bacteroidetes bacterium 4572_128]|nr:MAG: hypothetical protein B6I24_11120 [Bacteroidetes bacterium 4572_128]
MYTDYHQKFDLKILKTNLWNFIFINFIDVNGFFNNFDNYINNFKFIKNWRFFDFFFLIIKFIKILAFFEKFFLIIKNH